MERDGAYWVDQVNGTCIWMQRRVGYIRYYYYCISYLLDLLRNGPGSRSGRRFGPLPVIAIRVTVVADYIGADTIPIPLHH